MIYDWYVTSSKEIGVRAVMKSGVPEVEKAAVRSLGLKLWGGSCGVHVVEWSGVARERTCFRGLNMTGLVTCCVRKA